MITVRVSVSLAWWRWWQLLGIWATSRAGFACRLTMLRVGVSAKAARNLPSPSWRSRRLLNRPSGRKAGLFAFAFQRVVDGVEGDFRIRPTCLPCDSGAVEASLPAIRQPNARSWGWLGTRCWDLARAVPGKPEDPELGVTRDHWRDVILWMLRQRRRTRRPAFLSCSSCIAIQHSR